MTRATLGELLKSQLIDGKKNVSEADEQRALDTSLPLDVVRGTDQPTAVDRGLWLDIYEHVFAAGQDDTTEDADITLAELFLSDTPVTAEKLRWISEHAELSGDESSDDTICLTPGSTWSIGDSVAVNYEIENTGDAASASTKVEVYLSPDLDAVRSDDLLYATAWTELLYGDIYVEPENFAVELSSIGSGTYYVTIVSDENTDEISLDFSVGGNALSLSGVENQTEHLDTDVLFGGASNDLLVGGAGQDRIVFCSGEELSFVEGFDAFGFEVSSADVEPARRDVLCIGASGTSAGSNLWQWVEADYHNQGLEKSGCFLVGDHHPLGSQVHIVGDGAVIGKGMSSWLHVWATSQRFEGVTIIVPDSGELRGSDLLLQAADRFRQANALFRCSNLVNETRCETGHAFENAVAKLLPCPNAYNVWQHGRSEPLPVPVLWRALQWLKHHGEIDASTSEGLDYAALRLLWESAIDGDTESREIMEYLRAEIFASVQRTRSSTGRSPGTEVLSRFGSTRVVSRPTRRTSRRFSHLS